MSAQRRPGRSPRRHPSFTTSRRHQDTAQRRPGRSPRGDTRSPARCPQPATTALNEGRGVHPGDTPSRERTPAGCPSAQRRPGRSPRRHPMPRPVPFGAPPAQRRPGRSPRRHGVHLVDHEADQVRSTKAGAFTPATPPPLLLTNLLRRGSLNEGRGVHPGDTPEQAATARGRALRSTKAGAFTPATLARPAHRPRDAIRSTKAGAFTPATPPPLLLTNLLRRGSLNEGRGVHPRRHSRTGSDSTRPCPPLNEGRGVHPGDTCAPPPIVHATRSAQRRPGRSPRRHVTESLIPGPCVERSTKAGAFTPATPAAFSGSRHPSEPLNEGRGVHPGDTRDRARDRLAETLRSTKAGAFTPATRGRQRGDHAAGQRSTKAGAFTPATRVPPATATSWPVAQRRPGRSPRRHPDAGGDTPKVHRALNEGRGVHPGDTRPRTCRCTRG